ncbi:serine hydrolase domain-containing protein [Sphingomonas sp. ASV193]|uniref:serine hydrolase domain-containing protein n=1 Tax=Sphingomonas sp. ASV193 TaxID=3144405 RepID=UPI0032E8AE82
MERQLKYGLAAFAAVAGLVAVVASHGSHSVAPADRRAKAQEAVRVRLVQVDPNARHAIDYAALDARLQQMITRPAMVGMAVGVVENGRITFLKGYGDTIEGSGDKVTTDTVFRWASCSKGVAGTLVAKLAEQGKLSLDEPIADLGTSLRLPMAAERWATVTDLLSHRLGLYRNALDNKLEEGADPHALRGELGGLNPVCKPGTCWNYQNVAYDAASEIVIKKTGLSYDQAARQLLFNPIGMTSASTTMAGLESAKSWARPHSVGRRPLPMSDAYYRVPAAGGMNSNIRDMAMWMLAQMGEMPLVLDPKLLDTIHAPLVATPLERQHLRKFLERLHDPMYGLGWRSYDYEGHHIVGHRGGINGYRSLILFDPALKSGVVALWNSNTNQPGGLEFEVMDMLYKLPFRDWMELGHGGQSTDESDGNGDR